MSLILKVTINDVFRKTPKLTPPCTAYNKLEHREVLISK